MLILATIGLLLPFVTPRASRPASPKLRCYSVFHF
uniref:Uncharacterized protein n=1 Tax=Arundo donax TaxID=35708 RepID=A0A0A8ZGV7_ARUDO